MKIKFENTFEINNSEVLFLYSKKLKKGALIGVKPSENKIGFEYDVKEYDVKTVDKIIDELNAVNADLSHFKSIDIDTLPSKEGIVETFEISSAVSVMVEGEELAIRMLQTMSMETNNKQYSNKDSNLSQHQKLTNKQVIIENINKEIKKENELSLPEKEYEEMEMN